VLDSPQAVKNAARSGRGLPERPMATEKLSWPLLNRKRSIKFSRKLKRYTPQTLIDPDLIRKGKVEAVIAIPGPSYRIPDERMTLLGEAVCPITHTLTALLQGVSGVVLEATF
jgi:hypothetical protein